MNKTLKIVLGTIIGVIVGGGITFAGVCFAPSVQNALNQPNGFDAQTFGLAFFIGMTMGFFMFIWYPIAKVMNWLKTRKLRNANLELDLQIKQKHLDKINNNQPVEQYPSTPNTN